MLRCQISIKNTLPATVISPTLSLISFYEKEISLSPAPRATRLLKNDAIHSLTSSTVIIYLHYLAQLFVNPQCLARLCIKPHYLTQFYSNPHYLQ